jgi:hypothetical protein
MTLKSTCFAMITSNFSSNTSDILTASIFSTIETLGRNMQRKERFTNYISESIYIDVNLVHSLLTPIHNPRTGTV